MTTEYEAELARYIEEFSATRRPYKAVAAAFALAQPDAHAPVDADTTFREQSRIHRVILWGRLFCAIDALQDPRFDPEKPRVDSLDRVLKVNVSEEEAGQGTFPAVDAQSEPNQQAYRERWEKEREEGIRYAYQYDLYKANLQVSTLAEDYFKSVFVRSANSASIVDRCADSGHWTSARHQQVRGWVVPVRP